MMGHVRVTPPTSDSHRGHRFSQLRWNVGSALKLRIRPNFIVIHQDVQFHVGWWLASGVCGKSKLLKFGCVGRRIHHMLVFVDVAECPTDCFEDVATFFVQMYSTFRSRSWDLPEAVVVQNSL